MSVWSRALLFRGLMNKKIFHFVMIKPSHYDDDGYVIQFYRSAMPSNTLATLCGLAEDCRRRQVLGDDVEIRFSKLDETNKRVRVRKSRNRACERGPVENTTGILRMQEGRPDARFRDYLPRRVL